VKKTFMSGEALRQRLREQTLPARGPVWLLGAAAVLLAGSVAIAAGRQDQPATPDPAASASADPDQQAAVDAAEEEFALIAEETIDRVCTQCHPWEQILQSRRGPREWADVVLSMAARGASGTREQFATIEKYLTRWYGMVAINRAPAADISAVLGLSPKEAEAIVAYRTANGNIADLAALLKVPGINTAKIEEQPEAIRFD
jgi:competence ComEA-like helix-hairpin-helix protein